MVPMIIHGSQTDRSGSNVFGTKSQFLSGAGYKTYLCFNFFNLFKLLCKTTQLRKICNFLFQILVLLRLLLGQICKFQGSTGKFNKIIENL